MMAELGENAPVYSFLPFMENGNVSKAYFIPFGLRKGKNGNLVVTAQSYN